MKLTLLQSFFLRLGTLIMKCLYRLNIPADWLYEYKHSIILHYIENNYKDLLEEYKTITPPQCEVINSKSPIYVMWYQGEERMPPIVKACYVSIKKHAGEHPVILVTQDNIHQLLADVPIWDNEIFDYLERKKIILAHLADLFRICLLYEKGGIWIDATVLMNWDVDRVITQDLFFVSARKGGVRNSFYVAKGKWSSFFIGSCKGNLLMKFMYELLLAHLKKEGRIIDYFMIDYIFETAYKKLSYIKEMVDELPVLPNRFLDLHWMRNNKYDANVFRKMCCDVPFFKMTYKKKLKTEIGNGNLTYYGFIIRMFQ